MQINVYGKGHRKAVQDYVLYVCSTYYYSGQTTGRRTGGGTGEPQILANQLTLFQPEGTLLLPPDFQTFHRLCGRVTGRRTGGVCSIQQMHVLASCIAESSS